MPAITSTVWVNVGLATVVFIYFNYLGIQKNGLLKYIAHFFGPAATHKEKGISLIKVILWAVALPLFCIEIFSVVLRVLTLNLRLYWNISADHTVVELFTEMLGPVFPAPIICWELLFRLCKLSFLQHFLWFIFFLQFSMKRIINRNRRNNEELHYLCADLCCSQPSFA